jgi:hypothetical protein
MYFVHTLMTLYTAGGVAAGRCGARVETGGVGVSGLVGEAAA